MEPTVTISLEEYKRLKKLDKPMQLKHNTIIYDIISNPSMPLAVLTDDDAVHALTENLNEVNKKLIELNKKCRGLAPEMTVMDITEMSYWEFREWRKTASLNNLSTYYVQEIPNT